MDPINAYLAGALTVVGMIFMLWFVFKSKLGNLFFIKNESHYSFKETVKMIRQAIESQNQWTMLQDKDFNEAYQEKGKKNLPVYLHEFKLGNPEHSYRVNSQDASVSVFMPASVAVIGYGDGRVEIIRKNTAFMGEMFPGEVGRIMRKEVPSGLDNLLCGIKVDKSECKSCDIEL